MNSPRHSVFLAFLVALSPAVLGAAEPAGEPRPLSAKDTPEKIIDRSLQALGGQAKIDRWKTGSIKYVVGFNIFGDTAIEETFQYPGSIKRIVTLPVKGGDFARVYVIRDGKGWVKGTDEKEARPIPAKGADRDKHVLAGFIDVGELKKEGVTLKTAGEEKVGDKTCILLHGESESLGKVKYYFDKDTALLYRSIKKVPNPIDGKETLMTATLKDYKEIQGGKVPMHITAGTGEATIFDIRISELRFVDKVDDKEFAKP